MKNDRSTFVEIEGCRSCGARSLLEVLSLGEMPLADALVPPAREHEVEQTYPLTLVFCEECSLVQILETVPPGVLFGDEYPYYSSFSDALVEHARQNVEAIVAEEQLGDEDLVVEIASNDGYLLQWFKQQDIPVLGVDPAPGPAQAAVASGIPTVLDFFTSNLAAGLRSDRQPASVIIGNNVLAHVPNQNDFVAGVAKLLRAGGSAVFEFPYVRDLIDRGEFDTIYHEHHCYFSVRSVGELFARHGLEMYRVQRHPIHGGSLRCFFSTNRSPEESVGRLLSEESELGLDEHTYYRHFAQRVERIREDLEELIDSIRQSGSSVAAYGAAAKGAVMLNYTGLDHSVIDYVVDRNPHKQGWRMPGVGIPIEEPAVLLQDRPDYVLLLAWNFRDEILDQQSQYRALGGKFIVPIPTPAIL